MEMGFESRWSLTTMLYCFPIDGIFRAFLDFFSITDNVVINILICKHLHTFLNTSVRTHSLKWHHGIKEPHNFIWRENISPPSLSFVWRREHFTRAVSHPLYTLKILLAKVLESHLSALPSRWFFSHIISVI